MTSINIHIPSQFFMEHVETNTMTSSRACDIPVDGENILHQQGYHRWIRKDLILDIR